MSEYAALSVPLFLALYSPQRFTQSFPKRAFLQRSHLIIQKTDADHALLAVIAPNIGKVIGRSGKHPGSIGEVDTSVQQHQLALRLIPRQLHIDKYLYLWWFCKRDRQES